MLVHDIALVLYRILTCCYDIDLVLYRKLTGCCFDYMQAYMEAMQSQWSWLIQLTVCLEQHVKFKALYHQFFKDCKTCDEDIDRQMDMLSSRYSQEHLDSDEAKQRVKELQELQKHLTSLQHHIETLVHRSGEVPPLQLRSSPVQSPVRVQCLCTYRQPEVKTNVL